jgi:hypothetical protein
MGPQAWLEKPPQPCPAPTVCPPADARRLEPLTQKAP